MEKPPHKHFLISAHFSLLTRGLHFILPQMCGNNWSDIDMKAMQFIAYINESEIK